jgi:hypothetical protein
MASILVKNEFINLDNSTQYSKKKRPFRLSATESFGTPKWINGVLTTQTKHTFRYLDVDSEFFSFTFGYYGEFLTLIK